MWLLKLFLMLAALGLMLTSSTLVAEPGEEEENNDDDGEEDDGEDNFEDVAGKVQLAHPAPFNWSVCYPHSQISKSKCTKLAKKCNKAGHPMLWAGPGCRVNGFTQYDGGCQCKGFCGYTCKKACNFDSHSRCRWDKFWCTVKRTGEVYQDTVAC
ncbi:hypothetical protein BASA81_012811 [Batrachochytrium salamandrivorans]|nr:hypothetical protein BASA81_012811 [Batrachochytrium salamandrivorans]